MTAPRPRAILLAIVPALAFAACGGGGGTSEPPLPPAVNTVPFTGGVYFPGIWQQQIGLQRIWPTRATNYYTGFQPLANPYFVFRPSDGQLFYAFQPYGVFIDDSATTADSMVPTPPCAPTDTSGGILAGNFELPFGFDGQNGMYYYCDGLERDGQPITGGPPPGFFYVGVLGDGRLVVQVSDPYGDPYTETYAAMAPDGTILSTLDLGLAPPYELLPESITVQGNDAFVLAARLGYDSLMSPCPIELDAYRLDPQSNWLPVRSVPITCGDGVFWIVLSDGTVLMWNVDTLGGPSVTAYLPDGTNRVAWRLADSPGAESTGLDQMPIGPREPGGASLQQE